MIVVIYFPFLYRRINSGANNGNYQYLIPVPAIAVVRPIYQRFSVPPPSLPSMNNNYNMPPMKQQISPAARRSMIRADTPKRDQSYDNLYEHPPPNVSANNFVGSYANALMHGGSNGMANQNSQQQNQNGTVNSMMPPPGCYIPRYPTDRGTAYAPRPHTDAGRISNDEASQYPGMGAPIGAGGDQNGPGLHFEPLPRATASHPSAIAPPQEPAWPNNKSSLTKMKPMFEFTEKAKNLPPGMEVGSQMQIGEYGNKMPIGEYGKNMPIGMPKTNGEMKHGPMFEFNERAKNLPPGMEAGSKMTIGDYGKKQSIGDYGSKMPIGEYGSKMPIGEYGKNMPIGMEMTNNLPINSNLPIGNNLHGIGMPQTNSDMMHHGMEIVRMKPKALSTETEKRYDQELEKDLRALEQRISTEFCKISDPLEKKLLMNLTPSV